jgi:hypothetical protein
MILSSMILKYIYKIELNIENKKVIKNKEEMNNYLNGEYSIILKLQKVISNKDSKLIADQLIDKFSAMQNLRTAIYDYKKAIETKDISETKYKISKEVGEKYLKRYFFIIVFNEYLNYYYNDNKIEISKKLTFKKWFELRKEISSILKTIELK